MTESKTGRMPRVVILGGGFGGLYAARALKRARVGVTLVDRRNFHLFQPLLYQVATAALSPGDIAGAIRAIVHGQKNLTVWMGEVVGVDVERRCVHLAETDLPYDYLVVATGATHAYFGHREWEQEAPGLKTIDDAIEMRRRFLLAFEAAERESDAGARRRLLTFVIVGAGPTGVELAGAMAEIARKGMRREFDAIDTATARVILLEGGPRILAAYPPELSQKAQKQLAKLGVEVRTGALVTAIEHGRVRVRAQGGGAGQAGGAGQSTGADRRDGGGPGGGAGRAAGAGPGVGAGQSAGADRAAGAGPGAGAGQSAGADRAAGADQGAGAGQSAGADRAAGAGQSAGAGQGAGAGQSAGASPGGDEVIEAGNVFWAAGVAASPVGKTLGAPLDRAGRVLVQPDLSIPGHPEVFVVGDLAHLEQDGAPVPGVAPAAMQMGRHVAKEIRREVEGKPREPFRYFDKGSLAVIGRAAAVAHIGRLNLSGFFAWLVWLFVHITYLIGFRNRLVVLLDWGWAYLFWRRGVRLITGEPRLELERARSGDDVRSARGGPRRSGAPAAVPPEGGERTGEARKRVG